MPFGCSIDASQQQMALNFELVVSDQLFSVVLAHNILVTSLPKTTKNEVTKMG